MSVVARPEMSRVRMLDAAQDAVRGNKRQKNFKKIIFPQTHDEASINPAENETADQAKGSISRSISNGSSSGVEGYYEDLHIDFLLAVFDIGLKVASPKLILEKMPTVDIMTLDRIKSHLQKVRQNKNRSYKEFLKIHDRLLLDGLKTWIFGLETVLNDDYYGCQKEGCRDKQEPGVASSSHTPTISFVPPSQPNFTPSFPSSDLILARDPLVLGPRDISLDLGSNLFKTASMSSDNSTSLGLSGGFTHLDPQKALDGQSTSADWQTFNMSTDSSSKNLDYTLQPGGYVTSAPSAQGTRAASLSDPRNKYSKTSNPATNSSDPSPKGFLPDIVLEMSEAVHDLFAGLQVPPPS